MNEKRYKKYSYIEAYIRNNPHLKNKELAENIGRSISWIKAFKAFMNSPDKEKHKNSKNPIYKAIYNAWKDDIDAQIEWECCEKNEELIRKIEIKTEIIEKYKKQIIECQTENKRLADKVSKLRNKLNRNVKELAETYMQEYMTKTEKEKQKLENKIKDLYKENEELARELFVKRTKSFILGILTAGAIFVLIYSMLLK